MVAHLLFEQSGTFKNAFIKLGLNAFDYDIEKTDNVDFCIDLFKEIEKAYNNGIENTIFENIEYDDIIIGFFPCTFFSQFNMIEFTGKARNNHKTTNNINGIIERANERHKYYLYLLYLIAIAKNKNLKLVIENPYTNSYLLNNIPYDYIFIDKNRRKNGDYYIKPTMFLFYNFKPSFNLKHDFLIFESEKKKKKYCNVTELKGLL